MNPNMRKPMTGKQRSYLIELVADVEMKTGVTPEEMNTCMNIREALNNDH